MAELVDASVSNTDGVKPVPVRSRLWALQIPCKSLIYKGFLLFQHVLKVCFLTKLLERCTFIVFRLLVFIFN